jgi:hypothetical protein
MRSPLNPRAVLELLLILACAVLLILWAASHAHADGPTLSSGKCEIDWDVPTTNTDGSPLTDLKEYRVYVGAAKGAFAGAPAAAPNPGPGLVVAWDCRAVGLTTGQKYLTVRAADLVGNESANGTPPTGATWTAADGLPFVFDGLRPTAPNGLKIGP